MFHPGRDNWKDVVLHGAEAGMVSGVVLLGVIFLVSGGADVSAWLGPDGAGALLSQSTRQDGGRVIGLISHFLVAGLWGIVFALVAHGFGRANTIATGALFGLLIWVAMYWVVLPLLGLSKWILNGEAPAGASILEHVLFGVTLGLVLTRVERGRFFRRAAV